MNSLFDAGEAEPRRSVADALARPLAARMRPQSLDEVVGQEHLLGRGLRAARRDRAGPAALDDPLRPPGLGEDDAGADRGGRGPTPRWRSSARSRPAARRCARCSSARSTAASWPSRRSSSSTRSTASTRPSRTRCCPRSRRASSPSSAPRRRTPTSRSTRRCSRAARSTSCARCWPATSRSSCAVPPRGSTPRPTTTRSPSWPRAPAATRARRSPRFDLAVHTHGRVTLEAAQDALQRRALTYDKTGDRHYDTISAWIKATRGSDPDASLYYLAVMLEGGEDPRFIVRRMVILASEDIGNADPRALEVAVAAAQAVEHVGLPEGQFALAQAAIYLSLAPKSDSAKKAIGAAREHVREHGAKPPPRLPAERRLQRGGAAGPRRRLRLPARPPRPPRPIRSSPRRAWRASASTGPTRPRPRCASAWRRSAARAGGSLASPWRRPQPLPSWSPSARPPASDWGRWRSRDRARSPPPWTRRRACSRCGRCCASPTGRATWPARRRR